MRTTIDAAGRVVIPKAMRDELGLGGGGEVDVELDGQTITIAPPLVPKEREEHDGRIVLRASEPVPKLTDEAVQETLIDVRR